MGYATAQIEMRSRNENRIRFVLFLISIISFCLLEFSKIQGYLNEMSYCISSIEYAYLITACGANLPYTSMAVLLLLENGERSRLDRSGRKALRQIRISFCVGLFATVCIVLFSLIPASIAGKWSLEWSEPVLLSEGLLSSTVIPQIIYTTFSPLEGLLISVAVLTFFWAAVCSVLIMCKDMHIYHLGVIMLLYLLFWTSIHLPNSNGYTPNWFFSLNAIIGHTKANEIATNLMLAIALDLGIIIISMICNAAREHYCHIFLKMEDNQNEKRYLFRVGTIFHPGKLPDSKS